MSQLAGEDTLIHFLCEECSCVLKPMLVLLVPNSNQMAFIAKCPKCWAKGESRVVGLHFDLSRPEFERALRNSSFLRMVGGSDAG